MTIVLRPITQTDSIAELTNLLHAAYAKLWIQGFNYTAVDQSEEVTRNRISKGECCLALTENRMVGTILFARHPKGCAWYERPVVAGLHQFGVLPEFQRKGIGSKLVNWAETRAVATGAAELALDTAESAQELVTWYERLGFRHVATEQWRGKSYRSAIMSKALGDMP